MGLISQANQIHARNAEPAVPGTTAGLLDRIRENSGYDRVRAAFSRFLRELGVERAGILFPSEDGIPVFVLSEGFDLTTTRRFAPDQQVLRDLLTDARSWNEFSGARLDQFRGFLSSKENESLSSLYLREVRLSSDSSCCLVVADSRLDARRTPFDVERSDRLIQELIDTLKGNCATLSALSLVISVNQSVESMHAHASSALEAGLTATMVRISFSDLFPDPVALQTDRESQSIYGAIVHRIARQTGKSNILRVSPSFDVKIVLFTALPVDTAMYFWQLLKPLERIFGEQRISRISCSDAGTGSSLAGIMEFLTGAN